MDNKPSQKNGWYREGNEDVYYVNGVAKFRQPIKTDNNE